jgi:hypothetical protein
MNLLLPAILGVCGLVRSHFAVVLLPNKRLQPTSLHSAVEPQDAINNTLGYTSHRNTT